jgi:hypothetical protein
MQAILAASSVVGVATAETNGGSKRLVGPADGISSEPAVDLLFLDFFGVGAGGWSHPGSSPAAFHAPFLGSTGGQRLNAFIVGLDFVSTTSGCYEGAANGGIFAHGAPFQGSAGNLNLNQPVVGMSFG